MIDEKKNKNLAYCGFCRPSERYDENKRKRKERRLFWSSQKDVKAMEGDLDRGIEELESGGRIATIQSPIYGLKRAPLVM